MAGISTAAELQDVDSDEITLNGTFRYQQAVSWGDCDPAQIAYTANIPAWGLLAIEDWYKNCVGADWYELNLRYGVGTPFVSLNFDFKAPVTPEHSLEIDVTVCNMGNTSLSHKVEGYQDGVLRFTGETTAAFVRATTMTPVPIPQNMRTRIETYMGVQNK